MPTPSTIRTSLALGAGVLVLAATAFIVTRAAAPPPPPCPEVVVADDRGDPRNAAGKIRFCWPGQAKCHCDRDGDCYALEGHVACTALAPGSTVDAGAAPRLDAGTRADVRAPVDAVVAPPPPPPPPPAPDAGPAAELPPVTALRAFPGAEGFGASATGGRGGRVVFVTTLAASGPGSLADALAQSGARTVIFRVSGVIPVEAHLLQGDVTIAGQTSPGGITVRGFDTTEPNFCDQVCGPRARGVSNFIVRFLRSRPAGGDFPDGLRLRYARNGIVDHVSVGNAADEAVEISYANNITLQDSLLAETVGGHAQYGGVLINYTNPAAGYQLDNLTILRTVWNRIAGRYPEFSRESGAAAAGTTLRAELTNNLLWDQRYFIDVNPRNISGADSGSAIHYALNWVGNVSVATRRGAGASFGLIWFQGTAKSSAYFADNRSSLWPTRRDWDFNYCCNDFAGAARARPAWARTARYPHPAVRVLPGDQVQAYAVANAGAFPRDPMDRRLMDFVARGVIDTRPIDRNPANDALLVVYPGGAPPMPADGDVDGMADDWERAHGLNPTIDDHNGTLLSRSLTGVDGYTNLECYLDALARQRVREGR